jgi:hypothetical protein
MATQNPSIGIYDHTTGETLVREMTADELADYESGLEVTAKAAAAKAQAAADKAAAEAKLAALGLTPDDLKALGL